MKVRKKNSKHEQAVKHVPLPDTELDQVEGGLQMRKVSRKRKTRKVTRKISVDRVILDDPTHGDDPTGGGDPTQGG
jgi:hypothetical protein